MSDTTCQMNHRGRAVDPQVTHDEKTWALVSHLSLLGHMFAPYVAIIAPIAIWLIKKNESRFIDDHGRECINFQLSLMIYTVVLPLAAAVIAFLTCGIGVLLMIPFALLPYVLGIIGMIMGALAANRGEYFRYPMTIRFLR